MKKTLVLMLALLMILTLTACSKPEQPAETDPAETPSGTGDAAEAAGYEGPEFFVSLTGDDSADGSEKTPFASPARALERVHELREAGSTAQLTINILPGKYTVTSFTLEKIDGGTAEEPTVIRGYGDGETVLSAAKELPLSAFKAVDDEEMKARFYPEAADKILVCDLAAEGVTAEMIGRQLGYGYSSPMPDEQKGMNVGLFWNDTRLLNARYPNDSGKWLYEDQAHVEEGGVVEETPGTIRISGEVADHVARWKTLDGAMVHDYFNFNWAEETTPVTSYDAQTGELTVAYSTAIKEGAEYYFFNVAEELDAPGEYWIDRENLKLYVYPADDSADAVVKLAYYRTPMFGGEFCNVLFSDLTLEGTCGSIFYPLSSEGATVKNCILKNFEEHGFRCDNAVCNNTIYGCEIFNAGQAGAVLHDVGNYETLTHANNRIENNKLHDFAQIVRMYSGGFGGTGVGNTVSHNEIWNSPHAVLSYGGLENTIEWNYVHDVVQESDDAGAFYGGGQWEAFGNVIEHNKFERIGNEFHYANGIYFDDMLSGWTARCNVLIDVYGYAFMCGGGRSHTIENNIVINHGTGSYVYYDERMREIYLTGNPAFSDQDSGMWAELRKYPYDSGIWAERYPQLAAITFDTSDIDNPDFPINPAYSVIKNNIFIGRNIDKWNLIFWDSVRKYSEIGEYLYSTDESRVFEEGTYELNKIGKRSKIEYMPVAYDGYGTYAD